MATATSWPSSTSIICINDCNTMALSANLPLSTCVNAEIKKKTARKSNNSQVRSSKQVADDDMPLAILAYQKGLLIDKQTSPPNHSISSLAAKTQRKKRHSPPPSTNNHAVMTTKSSRKNHYSAPTMTTITENPEKEDRHGYRYSFSVTGNKNASLGHIYYYHNSKNTENDGPHYPRTLRRSTKSTYTSKANDHNNGSSPFDTPTVQIRPPSSSPLSKKKDSTISPDPCTTTAAPEPCSPNLTTPPKSGATCFSCLMIRRWSIVPLNRMFQKKKKYV